MAMLPYLPGGNNINMSFNGITNFSWINPTTAKECNIFDVSDIKSSILMYVFNPQINHSVTTDDEFFSELLGRNTTISINESLVFKKFKDEIGLFDTFILKYEEPNYALVKELTLIKDMKLALLNIHHDNYMIRCICRYIINNRLISMESFRVERLLP
jgi:hypothetical protein